MFGNLEQTCGEIHWRFGENIFGDLEKTYSAILGKNLSAFWRNRLANLEKSFGTSCGETYSAKSLGDLEKSFGASFGDLEKPIWQNRSAIWRNRSAILGKTVWRFHIGDHYGVL